MVGISASHVNVSVEPDSVEPDAGLVIDVVTAFALPANNIDMRINTTVTTY